MTLNGKKRLFVLLSIMIVATGGMIGNQIAIELGGKNDLNVKETYLFQYNHFLKYIYRNESSGADQILIIESDVLDETHTNITVWLDSVLQGFFEVSPEGFVYRSNVLINGNYSIWWVFVPNVFMMLGIKVGDTYDLMDPTGFLGVEWQNYSMTVTERITYWAYDPLQTNLTGAQSSFRVSMFEEPSHNKIASAIIDVTCGIIEEWEGLRNGDLIKLLLVDTSFAMSRNRYLVIKFDIIIGILMILVTFILTSIKWKYPKLTFLNLDKQEQKEILLLQTLGVICVIVEVVDIWFYLKLGKDLMMYMHLGLFAVLFAVGGFILKYGFKWSLPAFFEVAYVFALGMMTGDPYVPSITANMGSFIAWLVLVFASGIEKKSDGEVTGKTRFFADLI
jgi:hypothetical protein